MQDRARGGGPVTSNTHLRVSRRGGPAPGSEYVADHGVAGWPGRAAGSLRTASELVSGSSAAHRTVSAPIAAMKADTQVVLPVCAMSAVMMKGVPPLTVMAES